MATNTGRIIDISGRVLTKLRDEATAHDLPITLLPDGIEVETTYGTISAFREGQIIHLSLSSVRSGDLTVLRDAVHQHLDAGVSVEWRDLPRGMPENLHILRGYSVTELSPAFLRLRLVGNVGPLGEGGFHIRLVSPANGTHRWPEIGANGQTVWPDDMPLPHRPVYTITDWTDEMVTIDIFRHSTGRTSHWVEALQPGDEVGLMGPGGSGMPEAKHLSLWGDETALPAILRIIRDAPTDTDGTATLLVPSAADIRPVDTKKFRLNWLFRDRGEDLLFALDGPHPDAFFWFAADRAQVQNARTFAERLNLPKKKRFIAAYW